MSEDRLLVFRFSCFLTESIVLESCWWWCQTSRAIQWPDK